MSRQTEFQKKFQAQGLCGYCADHPPIHKANRCFACYEAACLRKFGRKCKPQPYGDKTRAKIATLEKRIDNHQAWIDEYRGKIEKLKLAQSADRG